ncbi:MAG TPA: hypothetical protein VGP73_08515 [Thermoanaerobaculia bacterium]
MSEQRVIKIFVVHQFTMSDLERKIVEQLKAFPDCKFIDMSLPQERPIPPDQIEFVQEIACGSMRDSDIIIILPDTGKGREVGEGDTDYISDLGGTFRSSRGLHPGSVYTVEIKTLMFDSCDTKPVLLLDWTKDSAEYLADKLRNPKGIGGRRYNKHRFYTMGLDEATGSQDIAERILSILDSWDLNGQAGAIQAEQEG